jgi:hypothetical protein
LITKGNKQQPLPELHHSLLMAGRAEVAALKGKRYFSGHEKILQDRISASGVELPILVNSLYFDFPGGSG